MARYLAVVAVLTLGGCSGGEQNAPGSGGGESAEAALTRQIGYLSDGQYRRAYAEIHPSQQALFTADQYEACVGRTAGALDIESVKVKETFSEEITLAGTSEKVQSVAITAEVKVKGIPQAQTDTYHEVQVGGAWRFTVSRTPDIIAGRC